MRTAPDQLRFGAAGAALGLLVACSGESPTGTRVLETKGVVISSPVLFTARMQQAGLTAPIGDSVVYVSLPPGTAPTGASATVRNVTTNATVTTPVYHGGFDPVALGARVGDTISVVVSDSAGTPVLQVSLAVRPLKPPVVVRTNPPPKKTDVPMNAIIVVVFSEPMNPRTMTPGALQLISGAPVAGSVTLSPEGITATFQPAEQLSASTSYVFAISDQVADLSGTRLERAVDVPFVTTATPPSVTAVTITPDSATLLVGTQAQIRADGWESPYGLVAPPPLSWSSSDTAVARVSATGVVTAVANGATIISAQWSQGTVTATLAVKTVTFASVSAGVFHTCGVTTDNDAYCWGDNSYGELGTQLVSVGDSSHGPVIVAGNLKFAAITVGDLFACGLTTDGDAYCWGDDEFGQLGNGIIWSSALPVPVLSGGVKFASLSAGEVNACGLTANGTAYCWGQNALGTVGDGSAGTLVVNPHPVSGGLAFRSIHLGFVHACGLSTSGQVYCWGALDYRQEPNFPTSSSAPILIHNGPFVSLGGGLKHSCAVAPGGAPYCWGKNNLGSLGIGSTAYGVSPTPVSGGIQAAGVTSGLGGQTCGTLVDGTLLCWGANAFGELGVVRTSQSCTDENGHPASCSTTPIPGPSGLKFKSTSAGQAYTCGIALDGIAYCWGHNSPVSVGSILLHGGELGDGTTTSSWRPVRVLGQP